MTEMPGDNNMFISPDIKEKYMQLCNTKVDELARKYFHVRYTTIDDIFNEGFLMGNSFIIETITEDELKDKYL